MVATKSASEADRWTRPAVTTVTLCFLVYIFDIYEVTAFQVALPAILADFNLTLLDAGLLVVATGWANRIAGLALVPLADTIGRRALLAWGVLGYSLLTGFTGLAQNFLQFGVALTVTRFPITAGAARAPRQYRAARRGTEDRPPGTYGA